MSNDKHRGLIVDSGDSIIDVLWECWVERHHLTAPINVKPQGGGTDYRRDIDWSTYPETRKFDFLDKLERRVFWLVK